MTALTARINSPTATMPAVVRPAQRLRMCPHPRSYPRRAREAPSPQRSQFEEVNLTSVPVGPGVKVNTTAWAVAGSRAGCQVNSIRRGSSRAVTWPHWKRRPSTCSSKISPPTRGSNTTRASRGPPMECVALGHHAAKSCTNRRKASTGVQDTVIERSMGGSELTSFSSAWAAPDPRRRRRSTRRPTSTPGRNAARRVLGDPRGSSVASRLDGA